MKTFTNTNPNTLDQAVSLVQQARTNGQAASLVGGGSDLLALGKDFIVKPDVLVNLKTIKGLDQGVPGTGRVGIGGPLTLGALRHHPMGWGPYTVLAGAGG